MPILYIYYKPSSAKKYNIRWKRPTDLTYPNGQSTQQDKIPGVWNNVAVNIPDTDTDWQYEIIAICDTESSSPAYGVVKANCKLVTLSAEYNHCSCATLNGIILTSG